MAIKTDNTVVTNTTDESTGVISLAKVEDTRQTFDLAVAREQYKQEILASGEVDKLTSQIDLSNTTSILEFGKAPATEMAKVADKVSGVITLSINPYSTASAAADAPVGSPHYDRSW